jgi:adenylate cyclase
MQLSSTLSWLVDAAGETPGADRLLAEVGVRPVADGLPLAGGALTLAVPHPLIARRTWLWRAESGEVIEALGFVAGGLAAGLVHEDAVGSRPDGPLLGWIGRRPFMPGEADELRQAALRRGAARRRRGAARVLAGPLRRDIGETIQAALLCADLRGFTALSESNPPSAVISALDAWFDRIAGAVHAFGGEVLKFIGDGVLAIFPVVGGAPRGACDAALRAVSAARMGMAHLDDARRQQGLPPLPFGAALHLGEMLWGNIGAADRLDFTAIGPAVNLVSRLEGLCRPLDKAVLVSGTFAAETGVSLMPLGTHALRGIASPCAVFTVPEH